MAAPLAAAPGPIDIGARRQLFIDRLFLAESSGVGLVVQPPRKGGAVLEGTEPWERDHIGAYLSVIEHGGMLKMWYMSFANRGSRLCYATSADGIAWTRPRLGLVEFEGSRDNNIVVADFREGAVALDPVAPPGQRFKTIQSLGRRRDGSLRVLTSPDGVHWDAGHPVLPFHADSMNTLFWDQRRGEYAAYLRGWNPLRVVVRAAIPRDGLLREWPHTPTPRPNHLWGFLSKPEGGGDSAWPPAISTELPTVLSTDGADPARSDIYTPNIQPYGDVYVAFPSMFRHTAPEGTERVPVKGVLDCQFAASRDGIRFERSDRRPYLARGLPGDHDSHGVYVGLGLIRRGDALLQFYGGSSGEHGTSERDRGAILRATQRLDGFVAVESGSRRGEFTTPELVFSGSRLRLNIDVSAMGSAAVEVVGRPGFAMSDCLPIVANHTAHEVAWRGGSDLSGLRGRPVRLRFALANARLYAFEVA
jgi:hypothetical protein